MSEANWLRIVVAHGESRTLWYIVDAAAPAPEQPCVLATGRSREEAEALKEQLCTATGLRKDYGCT